MFLPWYSVPGGGLERHLLLRRGIIIPPTGSAWQSLGLASILLVGLVLSGIALVVLVGIDQDRRLPVAVCVTGYGVWLVAVIVDRLFVGRPGGSLIVLGAGGYLGLAAAIATTIGAGMIAREHRELVAQRRADRRREENETGGAFGRGLSTAEPSLGDVGGQAPTPSHRKGAQLVVTSTLPAAVSTVELDADELEMVHASPARRWARIGGAMAAIIAVYLATRLWFVGHFPYFLDEVLYAGFTAQGAESAQKLFVPLTVGQPPLEAWLAIVWVKVGFAPLTAVRLVSVTSGLLTTGVVGLLGKRLAGAAVGWVSAALCVVLPFFVVHDGVGIYEPLVTLIMASALYLQVVYAWRPDLRVATLLGVVLAAGVLTKDSTLPALALLPVSLLCFDWSAHGRAHRLTLWLAGVAVVVGLVVAAEWVLRSSVYYKQLEAVRRSFLLYPGRSLTSVLNYPLADSRQAWATYRPALIGYVTVPLLAVGVVGAVLAWRDRLRLTAVLLTWIFVSFMVALLFLATSMPRHVMYVMPPVIVLIAYALVDGARWVRRHVRERAIPIVCAATVALLAPALVLDLRVLAHPASAPYPGLDYWQYVAGYPSGVPWLGVPDLIRKRGTGRQVVIVTPTPYGILTLQFWHDRRYVFTTSGSPLAARAQFAIFEGSSAAAVFGTGAQATRRQEQFVVVQRFSRPAGPCSGAREGSCGGVVTVLERRTSTARAA